jgi:hypothetical protein
MASRAALLCLLAAPAAAEQTPVAVELVLALDSSASVDQRHALNSSKAVSWTRRCGDKNERSR